MTEEIRPNLPVVWKPQGFTRNGQLPEWPELEYRAEVWLAAFYTREPDVIEHSPILRLIVPELRLRLTNNVERDSLDPYGFQKTIVAQEVDVDLDLRKLDFQADLAVLCPSEFPYVACEAHIPQHNTVFRSIGILKEAGETLRSQERRGDPWADTKEPCIDFNLSWRVVDMEVIGVKWPRPHSSVPRLDHPNLRALKP